MSNRYFARLENIDRLIRIKATGSPSQLAKRLDISESTLYELLAFMKQYGAPIVYSKERQSYYYHEEGRFSLGFLPIHTHPR